MTKGDATVDVYADVQHGPHGASAPRSGHTFTVRLPDVLRDVGDGATAGVCRDVFMRTSDAIYYDHTDKWAKVPYVVQVGARVTLSCPQTDEGLQVAMEFGHDLAVASARGSMGKTIAQVVDAITSDWYKEYFK